ncbi:hypothetical protein BDQ12DRAFT_619515 [Crucibulum laeve]|uniref:Prolyl 4-hydroxylase alpha subunit Fe(2+) 2OG dioxygenase domain-containing protein n=1 Tax=Crucibulum laeve TaxID=68775 RepID=A0A5C3LE65_9AGAR|nr:hypothetical protein BDQ12DRAFT_619515 [Crucibulum laeve]
MSTQDKIDAVKSAISKKPPYVSGTLSLPSNAGLLFYRKGEESSFLDLTAVSEAQLQALEQACEPATFGVNQKDVLDESYRKASKLDTSNFSTNLDLSATQLIDQIRKDLLEDYGGERGVIAELYKLNVYGPGSFFKAHKDTPRSGKMFGSLVVVFPTAHEGGCLILRQDGKEWTFDSAAVTSNTADPKAFFVAFYGDIEHEVSVVKSGYRVTLTYNLYFDDSPSSTIPTTILGSEISLKDAFLALLADDGFLPTGGLVGFGLRFSYPITSYSTVTYLDHLLGSLKGEDAVLKRVCDDLSLKASLKVVYEDKHRDGRFAMMDQPFSSSDTLDLDDIRIREDILGGLVRDVGGQIVQDLKVDGTSFKAADEHRCDANPDSDLETIAVLWITPLTKASHFKSSYLAYGNEPSLGYVYGDLCLVVMVGPKQHRSRVSQHLKERSICSTSRFKKDRHMYGYV